MKITREYFFTEYKQSNSYSYGVNVLEDNSYFNAFVNPPYGHPDGQRNFSLINQYLFSDNDSLIIYEWNHEWSDYFDPAKDMHDAFFWTVYDPCTKKLISMAGAATD